MSSCYEFILVILYLEKMKLPWLSAVVILDQLSLKFYNCHSLKSGESLELFFIAMQLDQL